MTESVASPFHGMAVRAENDHVALYVRLSRIFRQRILSREWPQGSQLPTVVELCKENGVAAITVRQALRLLADDGWIVATRGKGTFVTSANKAADEHLGLRAAINDPLSVGRDLRIKVLKLTRRTSLPADLSVDAGSNSYVHINKLHFYQGTPLALMDIYVAEQAYDRFPSKSEHDVKISRLFREFSNIPIKRDTQIFTIAYADHKAASLLKYSLGGVLVCMRSWWFDADEKIVFSGTFYYRGDMFVLERSGDHQAKPLLPVIPDDRKPARKHRSAATRKQPS